MLVHATSSTAAAEELVRRINDVILFPLITLLVSVALVVFLWGAFEYISNAESDEGRTRGRRHMIYGIIGLFVMLSAYTILRIAAGTFGLSP